MKNTRVSLLAALALVAFGVCSQAQAQGPIIWPKGDFQMFSTNHFGIVPPDSTLPGIYQGIVAMAPLPPTGTKDWPCFAGAADCANLPAGGLVIGQPQQVWSANCDKCGQIFFSFETTTISGECKVAVTVTQGDTILLKTAMTKVGNVMPNQIVTVPMTASFKGNPGPATITTTTKVGALTIHGKSTIVLQ